VPSTRPGSPSLRTIRPPALGGKGVRPRRPKRPRVHRTRRLIPRRSVRAACAMTVCGRRESSTPPRPGGRPLPSTPLRTAGTRPSRRPSPPRSELSPAASAASAVNGTRPRRTLPSPSPTASTVHHTPGTTAAPSRRPRPRPAAAGEHRPCPYRHHTNGCLVRHGPPHVTRPTSTQTWTLSRYGPDGSD
jgi:hypothetical protein